MGQKRDLLTDKSKIVKLLIGLSEMLKKQAEKKLDNMVTIFQNCNLTWGLQK